MGSDQFPQITGATLIWPCLVALVLMLPDSAITTAPDRPRGVYITGIGTTDGPDAGTDVFEVLNLPRLNGTRGSQMAFTSSGVGADQVFARG